VGIQVTNGGGVSGTFTLQMQLYAPGFFAFNGGPYAAATHLDGTYLGPPTLYPSLTTPAHRGELVVFYANRFGQTMPANRVCIRLRDTDGTLLLTPKNVSDRQCYRFWPSHAPRTNEPACGSARLLVDVLGGKTLVGERVRLSIHNVAAVRQLLAARYARGN
jgi:hypothetical protein